MYALRSQLDGAPRVEVIRVSEEGLGWGRVSVRVTMAAPRCGCCISVAVLVWIKN